jgi:hypothetical protein
MQGGKRGRRFLGESREDVADEGDKGTRGRVGFL